MAVSTAYWVNPYGKILNVGYGDHIGVMIKNPEQFHLSKDEVETTYKKYNERVGQEGKAREELIKKVLAHGFIRIRLYVNKYWSINTHKWDRRTKKAISKWAEIAKDDKMSGKYMPVKIDHPKGIINDFTVEDLYFEKHLFEGDEVYESWFVPEHVDSIAAFSELKIIRLIKL